MLIVFIKPNKSQFFQLYIQLFDPLLAFVNLGIFSLDSSKSIILKVCVIFELFFCWMESLFFVRVFDVDSFIVDLFWAITSVRMVFNPASVGTLTTRIPSHTPTSSQICPETQTTLNMASISTGADCTMPS